MCECRSGSRADQVKALPANGQMMVSVDITNSGIREGEEVVQLYVKHSDARVAWPNEELKVFSESVCRRAKPRM